MLAQKGRKPVSDTDMEIAAMLIDELYEEDPHRAIYGAMAMIEGNCTFAVMFDDQVGRVYAICENSPLAVMHTLQGNFLASDVLTYLKYGRKYHVPGNGILCELTHNGIEFFSGRGERVQVPEKTADWDADAVNKMGYPHYMIKEIYEQPGVLRNTLSQYIKDGEIDFSRENLESGLFDNVNRVHLIACGTAMHAGLTARPIIETLAEVDANVEVSSEFRDRDTLYILISQSGETADTLAVLRYIKQAGARFVSVVNVRGSIMARESRNVLYNLAGTEIAVASTKTFTSQVALLYLIAMKIARRKGKTIDGALAEFKIIDCWVDQVLKRRDDIQAVARKIETVSHLFYLRRGVDIALAEEGALKIKEISYIRAEAYPAGEMKHGIISLIEPGIRTVMIARQKNCFAKALLCVQENRSRGGEIIMIVPDGWNVEDEEHFDIIRIPGDGGLMSAFPVAVALQLLAYECAQLKGLPIDQPRNLAKSVTVA